MMLCSNIDAGTRIRLRKSNHGYRMALAAYCSAALSRRCVSFSKASSCGITYFQPCVTRPLIELPEVDRLSTSRPLPMKIDQGTRHVLGHGASSGSRSALAAFFIDGCDTATGHRTNGTSAIARPRQEYRSGPLNGKWWAQTKTIAAQPFVIPFSPQRTRMDGTTG